MKRAKTFFTKDNISRFFKPTKKNIIIWVIILILLIAVFSISAKKGKSTPFAVRETDVVTRDD
ncbi:MAG: hypothetical protein IKR46_03770, partial [Clostridia bacterium]|nr:hypothetical protein [Clostridia bacterium]